ncbi:hypothetical protein LCGC14_0373440 [marine sediment metagenome]|uniref:Uncharacterized protein n=1 Tax=marine sediment metagenome TaxID=412755 RepID=A0A0F9TAD7_9ZZZZ
MTIIRSTSSKKRSNFPLEAAEQKAAWAWLATIFPRVQGTANSDVNVLAEPRLQDYSYMVPNGTQLAGTGKRRAIQMSNLKAQGLRPGVSDIVIAYPIWGKTPGHCLYAGAYIEMKRVREAYAGPAAVKAAIRPEQVEWLTRMASVGYWTAVAYGAEEFKDRVCLYLGGDAPLVPFKIRP